MSKNSNQGPGPPELTAKNQNELVLDHDDRDSNFSPSVNNCYPPGTWQSNSNSDSPSDNPVPGPNAGDGPGWGQSSCSSSGPMPLDSSRSVTPTGTTTTVTTVVLYENNVDNTNEN